jgi:glycosyltransferase involved in cell wall biosynthesis
MKILFYTRPDAFTRNGGDFVQLQMTKFYLEKMGYLIDISVESNEDLSKYDFVHIFNIQTSFHGIKQVMNAKKYKKKIFLSTIYWSTKNLKKRGIFLDLLKNFIYQLNPDFFKRHKFLYKLPILNKLEIFHKSLFMLKESDVLLPNSIAELENIVADYNIQNIRAKSFIVPNGVEYNEDEQKPSKINNLPAQYVLQVSSFTDQKGQLETIKSMIDHPEIPLVFIGLPIDKDYYDQCKNLGSIRSNTYFIDAVDQKELFKYYHHAHVHVLPSMRESPGLVSLEAAVRNSNCVISTHGPVNEYFGHDVFYCNPLDISSIEKAIMSAWKSDVNTDLKNRILNQFTWKNAAQKTHEAYQTELNRNVI